MALIKCSECGEEVSEKAASCPKCGNPIAEAEVQKTLVQMDTAPQKRRKYRIWLLVSMPAWFFGSSIGFATLLMGGNEVLASFWLFVGFMGFVGTVVSAIGLWLSKP